MRLRLAAAFLALVPLAVACLGEDATLAPDDSPVSATADAATPDAGSTPPPDASTPQPDAAACPPGLTSCSSTCVDTQTSKTHCGACGHDCGGGECTGGTCQPVTIKSGLHNPYGVTTVGNAVFWVRSGSLNGVEQGAVESCPVTGCPTQGPTSIYDFVPTPTNIPTGATILSDGVAVHWIARGFEQGNTDNYVYECTIVGCKAYAYTAGFGGSVLQITRSGTSLFFRNTNGSNKKCPFGDCVTQPTNTVTSFGGGDASSRGLFANATDVFFDDVIDNKVYKCAASGTCAARTPLFTSTAGSLVAMTMSGTTLVVTAGTTLLACETAGANVCAGQPTTLTQNQPNVTAMAADDKNVYFALGGTIGQANGEVRACAMPACAGGPKTIVSGLGMPNSLWLADDGTLYVAARGVPPAPSTGVVLKVRP